LIREPGVSFSDAQPLSRPGEAVVFIEKILEGADREHLGAIYLDLRSRLIGYEVAYIGTIQRASVEPRGILVPALLCNAVSLLIFHNHVSGDTSPSAEDIAFTRKMARAGELLGIRVIDHLIVGEPGRWTSLRDRGVFKDL
jgi:DNA repair protein RadC